ncbi:MAG: hypothetical protein M3068_12590 [Gemmatimonadota bacterium]|nr:hypothetical protein [Gemmatimonadota bacterium]
MRGCIARCGAALIIVVAGCGRDASSEGPYAKLVADAIPQIEAGTGLKFKRPPVVRPRSQAEFHDFMQRVFEREMGEKELAGQQATYRFLGLIPDTLDLRRLFLDFLTEQAVGLYDPESKTLWIRSDAKPEQLGLIVSHELVHALQDQYVNLDSIEKTKGDDDRSLAAHALIEGQAMLVPLQAAAGAGVDPAARYPGGWEAIRQLVRDNFSSTPVAARAPMVIRETEIFSYVNGMEFVRRFVERHPGRSPYGAAIPHSSEQLLHPEKYDGAVREEPLKVVLPAPAGATESYQNDIGEFGIRVFLYQHLKDQPTSIRAAAGWGGDRYVIVRSSRGEGLAWVSVWDTPLDAAEFRDALQEVIARRFGTSSSGGASGGARSFSARGRSLLLWAGEIAGKAAVMYVDVPAGASTAVIDPAKVQVEP